MVPGLTLSWCLISRSWPALGTEGRKSWQERCLIRAARGLRPGQLLLAVC